MISALPLLATVNGSPAVKAGAFRFRLPMALAYFAAAIALATVAAASTPLLRWMDRPGDGVVALRIQAVAPSAAPDGERRAGRRSNCSACGVVQAVMPLAKTGNRPASYELTVRLRDGSLRTSNVANTARWRVGDRIMLIGGIQSADL